jgi:predicted acylesterase/phospholipase RssA
MLAVILCLKYDWDIIDDYLLKRPWQNVYKFNMYSIIDSYHKRGIFDLKVIEDTFLPLFKGKDIPIHITLKEFYELTKIELHIFSAEIVGYNLIDISYKTHPDWKVIEAVYCSCCLPIIFSPLLKDGNCYCDGGFILNYPVEMCIQDGKDPKEIFGIRRRNKLEEKPNLSDTSSLLDFILVLLNKLLERIFKKSYSHEIAMEYIIPSDPTSIYTLFSIVNSVDEREKFINLGVDIVKEKHDSMIES